MNNQRRHELERNVLADKLGSGIEKAHPLIKPVGIALVVGIVGMFGYQIYNTQSAKKASKEWTEYYFNRTSGDAQSFEALGDAFSNSATGQWAKHSAARGFLSDGIEALYTNRKEAVENIRKAITEWETVKESSIAELRAAATQGLAQAHESLGELDEAVSYLQVFSDLPGTSEDQRKAINDQISYLKSSSAKGFYEWFNKLDPKPSAPPTLSGDLSQPPTTPSISLDPKDLPDFGSLPNTPPTNTDNSPGSALAAPASGIELTPPTAKPADPAAPEIEPATAAPTTPEPTAPAPADPATPAPAIEPTTPAAEPVPGTVEPAAPGPPPTDIPK
jgi:hypothetical protein